MRRQHLFQNRSQLHFRPRSAHLHVRQYLLQVADAGREVLHLAQPILNRFQSLTDESERVAETLFKGSLELLVHGFPYFLEPPIVMLTHVSELLIDGRANGRQSRVTGIDQNLHLLGKGLKAGLQQRAHLARKGRSHHPGAGGAPGDAAIRAQRAHQDRR